LNAPLAAVPTAATTPVIVARRRKASANSIRGAARMVADAIRTIKSCDGGRADRRPRVLGYRGDQCGDGAAIAGGDGEPHYAALVLVRQPGAAVSGARALRPHVGVGCAR